MLSLYNATRVNDIVTFKGKLSHNVLLDPMISNAYLLEDQDTVIIYDPSCGKEMAKRIEGYLSYRRQEGKGWKSALLIPGHSHIDHAGNMHVIEKVNAAETRIFVHENALKDGKILNDTVTLFESLVTISKGYFSRYKAFYFPASLIMRPLSLLDRVMPEQTCKLFGRLASLVWPKAINSSIAPEPLLENDLRTINLGRINVKGWRLGNQIVLPTPGHSSCSVSLLWPEKKALFVSDATWIGNPVFMFSSIRDSIATFYKFRELTEAGMVERLLPAHGLIIEGKKQILSHLLFHIGRMESMRDEILSLYNTYKEKDINKLTKIAINESPLLKTIYLTSTPKMVANLMDTVAICLREADIIT